MRFSPGPSHEWSALYRARRDRASHDRSDARALYGAPIWQDGLGDIRRRLRPDLYDRLGRDDAAHGRFTARHWRDDDAPVALPHADHRRAGFALRRPLWGDDRVPEFVPTLRACRRARRRRVGLAISGAADPRRAVDRRRLGDALQSPFRLFEDP